jgi:ribosomal protein S18 acetylase RimI-like enzyme
MDVVIRPYRAGELDVLLHITIESFDGVSFDQIVESKFGLLNGHDWRWRKARQIEDDVTSNPAGVFVAEADGQILGYITTHLDRAAGKARIPNLAITVQARGQGLGRKLIEHALEYLRREGLAYAMIETMAGNNIGEHLYSSSGFVEIGRQIHFAIPLSRPTS